MRELEQRIRRALGGLGVTLKVTGEDSGEVRIRYATRDEMQAILARFRDPEG